MSGEASTATTVSYAALPSMVLQCSCRRVVGDSTELVCTVSCGALQLVVLRGEPFGGGGSSGGWVRRCFEGRRTPACSAPQLDILTDSETTTLRHACSCHRRGRRQDQHTSLPRDWPSVS